MSDSKIHVKVGIVEFSGEGNQEWLASQLDKILEKVPELLKIEVGTNNTRTEKELGTGQSAHLSNLSVLNITGKLNSKSGGDLAIAAAAYLHFVEGKTSFTRDDISSNMKKATGIYKDSFFANLTTTLAGLEKNGSLLKSGNNYSLGVSKVSELNAILSK